jgi:inhibitor of cysteine peptidase
MFVAAMVVACGGQEMSGPDFKNLRAGGKADGFVSKTLSCQGSCGTIAQDFFEYCGCDDLCTTYGDCCTDKAAVCDGTVSSDAIVINKDMNGKTKAIEQGDKIDVQLPGNPSTGYAWHLLASNKSFPLQKEEYVPGQPQLTGSGGTYHFHFTADSFSVGNVFKLNFAYYRSWEGSNNAIETFVVKIAVTPSKDTCNKINADYQKELVTAAACKADADCGKFVGGNLTCGMPTKALNSALLSPVTALQSSWSSAQCNQIDWNCPMLSPLPPWMAVRGVCDQGACKAEYYDTRKAKEGASCGDDINVECADGLYCAFGLNWCGTPPVTGVCRQMGDCGAKSDCLNQNNDWIHPACMGQATCTAGQCGWNCGL